LNPKKKRVMKRDAVPSCPVPTEIPPTHHDDADNTTQNTETDCVSGISDGMRCMSMLFGPIYEPPKNNRNHDELVLVA
jgi:hypothetical protein